MAYEHKPGTGSLFKNDKAGDNPKAPMYKGKFMTSSGELIDLALWVQETKSGLKYFSVKQSQPFSAPISNDLTSDVSGYQKAPEVRSNATPAASKSIPLMDDLPF